jgi:FkbM family methyltransferase
MYSQTDEEKYITEYFNGKIGRCLDIGAYNPEVFSNTRKLIENGWEAVLVEPSPECFNTINTYYKNSNKVTVVNKAIGTFNGPLEFWDSEGANATAINEHYILWKNLQKDYKKITVESITWDNFYKLYPGTYDFISIDAEGMDYDILKQIDLTQTKTQLICVEYTYNTVTIIDHIKNAGFTNLIHVNGENMIVGKEIK